MARKPDANWINQPLQRAVAMAITQVGVDDVVTDRIQSAIVSAVRAVIPGRQQKKNLNELLETAYKAAARTLRRRAKS